MDSTNRFKSAKWLGNLILFIFTIVSCLLVGELIVRMLFSNSIGQGLGTASKIIVDAERGWKISPNYRFEGDEHNKDGSSYPVKLSFGPEGFRQFGNISSSRKKMFVIGDSFTMADQVSDDQTYYHRVGKKLGWEVFAYGCGGYATLQEYMVLDRYLDHIKPDIIVWQFCFNDFVNGNVDLEAASTRNNNGLVRPYWVNGKIEYLLPKPQWERNLRAALSWSRFAGFVFNRIDRLGAKDPDASVETVLASQGFSHPDFSKAMRATDEIFGKVRQRSDSIPIVGLYVNGLRTAEDAPSLAAFQDLCKKHGFICVPSSDAVERAERQGTMVRHADKAHWNVTGHQLVGDLVVKTIRREKILTK